MCHMWCNILPNKQAKHSSSDVWFTISSEMPIWKHGESPVRKMFRMRAAGRYQRFILGTSPSNAHYPHFLFGCCGEENINPRFCAQFGLTFDMGTKLGRVCINIHRATTFGLFAGYKLLMRPGKTSKIHSVFIFEIAGSSRSLNILF